MKLEFTNTEKLALKKHPEFSEKWLQDRICDDLSILGLGDIELVTTEKVQPQAGRLDILLHDDSLNRRYEVEIMLGATDPGHIVRCLEYWDIERRRYPAYDHVAVLVAEDITSRFLNVISLLAGSIPIIGIQLAALKIDQKIALHFVHVLDQTALRTDDLYEAGDAGSSYVEMDHDYWEKKTSPQTMQIIGHILKLINEVSGTEHHLLYRKKIIHIVTGDNRLGIFWLSPKKTMLHFSGYTAEPEKWVNIFEESGISSSLSRGNKAVRSKYNMIDMQEHKQILENFIRESLGSESDT